jgi:cysteinyl-tRNA synthetase
MSKSTGNTILPSELFNGDNPLLVKGFSPSVVRFFMMQAHYSSVLDFSNDALLAAEKGHQKLMSAWVKLQGLSSSKESTWNLQAWLDKCYLSLSDNFNSPILISHLFEAIKMINQSENQFPLEQSDLDLFIQKMDAFIFDILGLQVDEQGSSQSDALDKAMDLVITLRAKARENKDWNTADIIRDQLAAAGIKLKDGANGTSYEI